MLAGGKKRIENVRKLFAVVFWTHIPHHWTYKQNYDINKGIPEQK